MKLRLTITCLLSIFLSSWIQALAVPKNPQKQDVVQVPAIGNQKARLDDKAREHDEVRFARGCKNHHPS